MISALLPSSCGYAYYQYDPAMAEQPTLLHTALHTPAVDEALLAGSGRRPSLSVVASRSSGKASAHRAAALPRRRVAGGGGLALPRWLRGGEGGMGRDPLAPGARGPLSQP